MNIYERPRTISQQLNLTGFPHPCFLIIIFLKLSKIIFGAAYAKGLGQVVLLAPPLCRPEYDYKQASF
jgi:hypothetical protein